MPPLTRLDTALTRLHLPPYDIQGLVFGIAMTSLGVVFLKAAGLVTGQTAGIALLLSYLLPLGFGPLFFLIGLPFLVLAWRKRSRVFAIRTILVVAGISTLSQILAELLTFSRLDAPLAAVLGGMCSGMGLIAIFRHQASAGGMTILGIMIEQRYGIKAGWFQLAVDGFVFLAAGFVLETGQLLWSFLGAVITNMIILWNFDVAQSGTGRPGYGRPARRDGADQG